ncbi:MAG TPA: ATP-binding protein [Anaerolineales bacterium]|nr:ATP-binding protein [Anaerolineales bacterium]
MAQQNSQLTPEMLVPKLGDALVRAGRISESDLQKGLAYQKEQTARHQPYLLGQALIDLKLIDRATLDSAVTEQIIQLRSALQAANRNLELRVQERTAELQKALQRLSELSQMKANFVANVSHELRTPLTHVKGYLELMVTESLGPLTEEQRHALGISQKSAGRLESMIEDLIMFSLASRGEMSIKQEPMEIVRIGNLSVNTAAQKGEARGVEVHAVVDPNLSSVQGDSEKISWVLNQLLDNAVKFTPSGGHVVLSLKEEGANLVMVSITDTGIGIPANRLNEIFEPFHQLDGSATRRAGGTGLGLSLVRQIVEAHGSLLDVQSVEGKGTTFKFPLLAVAKEK